MNVKISIPAIALSLVAIISTGCTYEDMEAVADSATTCVETMEPGDLTCVKTLYTDVVIPATEPAAITAEALLEEMDPTK